MSFTFRWLKFYWHCRHFFSGVKRYYVRIPKKYKGPFINITVYPPDDCNSTYDPTDILTEFIRQVNETPYGLTNIYGFISNNNLLDLRTNLCLRRNRI
jgi:hypothetical protein